METTTQVVNWLRDYVGYAPFVWAFFASILRWFHSIGISTESLNERQTKIAQKIQDRKCRHLDAFCGRLIEGSKQGVEIPENREGQTILNVSFAESIFVQFVVAIENLNNLANETNAVCARGKMLLGILNYGLVFSILATILARLFKEEVGLWVVLAISLLIFHVYIFFQFGAIREALHNVERNSELLAR